MRYSCLQPNLIHTNWHCAFYNSPKNIIWLQTKIKKDPLIAIPKCLLENANIYTFSWRDAFAELKGGVETNLVNNFSGKINELSSWSARLTITGKNCALFLLVCRFSRTSLLQNKQFKQIHIPKRNKTAIEDLLLTSFLKRRLQHS